MSGAKKIGEIFSDYKTNSNIKYAQITALNVHKKTNTLEVIIYYDEYIEIKEIWYFEKFLSERFSFSNINMKIKYHEAAEKKSILSEWKNIIAYMSHKYPLMKPMLLLKSDVEINGKNILVKMHIKGADFLRAKKTDKELVNILENLFGEKYNIELKEELSEEEIKSIKKRLEHLVSIKGTDEYDMDDERLFDSDDFAILMQLAQKKGLSEGSGYIQYMQEFDYDEFSENVVMKINGQLFEFSHDSSNLFDSSALTSEPSINTDGLVDINLDELLQIDSQIVQEVPISELVEELKSKRKEFMTLKLAKGVKDIQSGIEPSSDSNLSIYREADELNDMLWDAGLKENADYIRKYHIVNNKFMTDKNPMTVYMRIGDNIIRYDEKEGRISRETSIQELEEYFKDDDINSVIEEEKSITRQPLRREFMEEPEKSQLIALTPIDLEQLGISTLLTYGIEETDTFKNAIVEMTEGSIDINVSGLRQTGNMVQSATQDIEIKPEEQQK